MEKKGNLNGKHASWKNWEQGGVGEWTGAHKELKVSAFNNLKNKTKQN